MAKATILFADNDPDFLKTRAEFLEQEGYLVIPASDPTEARRKLELGGIDLAIVDIRLTDDDDEKDVNGLILAKEVAQSVPKIILTGFPDYKYVREALKPRLEGERAAVDFVTKHEGPEALLRAVGNALSKGEGEVTRTPIVEASGTETEETQTKVTRSRQARIRQAIVIVAIVALLLAIGTGTYAVVTFDPRGLFATIGLAILFVVCIGLAFYIML